MEKVLYPRGLTDLMSFVSRLLMQIHDELLLEVADSDLSQVAGLYL